MTRRNAVAAKLQSASQERSQTAVITEVLNKMSGSIDRFGSHTQTPRPWGAGCKVQGAGCGVWGARCRVQGVGCQVQGVRCKV